MYKKIKYIFSEQKNIYFFIIFFILFIVSIFETLSIASVFPILNLLLSKKETKINIIDNLLFSEGLENSNSIINFCILIIVIFIFKNISLIILNWFKIKFTQNITKNLQIRILKNYLHLPILKFYSTNSSLLMRNVNGEPKMILKQLIHPFFILIQDAVISLGILILIFINLKENAIYGILFLILFFIPFYLLTKKKLKKFSEKRLLLAGSNIRFLRETVELIKDIKIYQKASFFLDRYSRSIEKLNFINLNINILGILPKLIIEILLIFSVIIILFVTVFVLNIEIIKIIPSIALIALAFFRLIPSTLRILSQYQKIIYSKPSLYLMEKIIRDSENYKKINLDNVHEDFNSLELKNISHKYNKDFILKNVNIKIKCGDTIFIKGESGKGKTTLLNIIAGLIKPTNGQLVLNDKDYIYNKPIIAKLSYVSGENYFIDESLIENITLKRKDSISKSDISKVIKILGYLNLSEFEKKIYDNIGEKSYKFSEGQKQRIAIARALYNNPSLLIFDEATNFIDRNSESIILENIKLNYPNLTFIFVSHRDIPIKKNYKLFIFENKNLREENEK